MHSVVTILERVSVLFCLVMNYIGQSYNLTMQFYTDLLSWLKGEWDTADLTEVGEPGQVTNPLQGIHCHVLSCHTVYLSGMDRDALVFTLKHKCGQMCPRSPQQVVSLNVWLITFVFSALRL